MIEVHTPAPLLRMRGIAKSFPGVQALQGVDLDLAAGEVHALVGENGAGKSTLMHILAGVYQPDAGTIDFNGSKGVVIPDERAAQELGIGIVFQERSLFSLLTVAENIFAARQPVLRFGRIDQRKLLQDTAELLQQVGLDVSPSTPLQDLASAQQQMVEIAKALSLRAKLIIFDEPTAALTETETAALFGVIRRLQQQQVGVVYISHRLEEIFEIADRVTVLKDGAGQGTFAVGDTTPDALVQRMVGRAITRKPGSLTASPRGRPVLQVRGLQDAPDSTLRPRLRDIDFETYAGEILALAGLAGAGRTELALALFGARAGVRGDVRLDGQPLQLASPGEAIRAGLGYLPEDRKEAGLFLEMSIAQNIAAARLEQFGSWWLSERRQRDVANEFQAKLRIACRGPSQVVQTLSGGNQQKVVLARWLLVKPKVLIVDEPTRGIDVGAKAEVHQLLRGLAEGGTSLIVISSELPEVLALADRILVMREGRLTGELSGLGATEESILRLASLESAEPATNHREPL